MTSNENLKSKYTILYIYQKVNEKVQVVRMYIM